MRLLLISHQRLKNRLHLSVVNTDSELSLRFVKFRQLFSTHVYHDSSVVTTPKTPTPSRGPIVAPASALPMNRRRAHRPQDVLSWRCVSGCWSQPATRNALRRVGSLLGGKAASRATRRGAKHEASRSRAGNACSSPDLKAI